MVIENLKNYPCKDTVSELTEGFLNGFKLHYASPHFHRESSNLVSAPQHKDELKAKVQKEIDLGRIVGPFKTLPKYFTNFTRRYCTQIRREILEDDYTFVLS